MAESIESAVTRKGTHVRIVSKYKEKKYKPRIPIRKEAEATIVPPSASVLRAPKRPIIHAVRGAVRPRRSIIAVDPVMI